MKSSGPVACLSAAPLSPPLLEGRFHCLAGGHQDLPGDARETGVARVICSDRIHRWQLSGESRLELALEPFDVAGVVPQLLVGGAFADAGQGPADGLRAVARDARGDQRVHDVQLGCLEPDHHVGELAVSGLAAVFGEPDAAARPLAAVIFLSPGPTASLNFRRVVVLQQLDARCSLLHDGVYLATAAKGSPTQDTRRTR